MIIVYSWLCLFVIMTLAWFAYCRLNNPGIVDVFWSICITVAGFCFALQSPISNYKLALLIVLLVWCLRLSGFLFITRILPHHVDPRYLALSKEWKLSKKWGFWLNYQLQAVLALIIALPFFWIDQLTTFNAWSGLGFVLSIIGIVGESIADLQLQQFKRDKQSGICMNGLWQYSRHPNYFFEWLVWLGFAITALHSALSLLALISPALLLVIFLKITGPMTEKGSIKRHGDLYRNYQQQTSMFIPWFKKQ